ncbi:MAG: hypothetical protein RQ715_07545 [Methylococcales bacterium]|nr:hypothetical protein [Methylococcales bacterium]
MLGGIFNRRRLNKAVAVVRKARNAEGAKASQLFAQAYETYAALVQGDLLQAEAMYRWGLALMEQAQQQPGEDGEALLEEAMRRFDCCRLLKPDYLAAALDGGVACLNLAKRRQLALDAPLYALAARSFEAANQIQPCAAAYNQACLAALNHDGVACQRYLEQARDHGVLPDDADIQADEDLAAVRGQAWFAEFLVSLVPAETDDANVADAGAPADSAETEVSVPADPVAAADSLPSNDVPSKPLATATEDITPSLSGDTAAAAPATPSDDSESSRNSG